MASDQRERDSVELQAAAFHEAGHAVAAMECRVKLTKVSIIADGDHRGYCAVSIPDWNPLSDRQVNSKMRYRLENLAIVALSGVAAEGLYLGHEPVGGFDSDVDRAGDYLSRLSESDPEIRAYFRWIHQRAKILVGKPANKPVIERLAEALLEHGVLEQQAVRSVRTDFMANGPTDASTKVPLPR